MTLFTMMRLLVWPAGTAGGESGTYSRRLTAQARRAEEARHGRSTLAVGRFDGEQHQRARYGGLVVEHVDGARHRAVHLHEALMDARQGSHLAVERDDADGQVHRLERFAPQRGAHRPVQHRAQALGGGGGAPQRPALAGRVPLAGTSVGAARAAALAATA
jgi:hypothetical protein